MSSRRSRRTKSKKEKLESEETIAAVAVDFSQVEAYGEDDDFYRKWSGPVLLGGFMPAIFSLIIIFSGQIVLNSFEGTCGYPLDGNIRKFQCKTCCGWLIESTFDFLIFQSRIYFSTSGSLLHLPISFHLGIHGRQYVHRYPSF